MKHTQGHVQDRIDPHDFLPRLIVMTAIAWQRGLNEAFERTGAHIVLEQWVILVYLQRRDGVVQGTLANMLMRDKSFLTRIVDDLERRQLVTRRRDPEDRRCWRIYLTDKGTRFVDSLAGVVLQASAEAESGLSRKQLDNCRDVLRAMFRNVTGQLVPECTSETGTRAIRKR